MAHDYFSQDNAAGIDQGSFGDRGSLIFDPSYNAAYYAPLYDGSVTVARMLPFFDKDMPDAPEVPYRGGAGFSRFSPWFMSYPFFKSIGLTGKINLVVNDPYVNPTFDKNSNPLCVLTDEIRKAVAHAKKNNGQLPPGRALPNGSTQMPYSWFDLVSGSEGKSAALPNMTAAVFVPALIYQHKSKKTPFNDLPIGLGADDPLPILELSGSLWTNSISRAMNTPKAGYQGNPADFENAYECGDPVSLAHGRFLHIFKKGSDPRSNLPVSGGAQYSQPQAGHSGGGDKKEIGYDAFFTKTLPGYGAVGDTSNFGAGLVFPAGSGAEWITERVRNMYVPLRKLIRCHTAAQQAAFVAAVFPAEILLYAWANHPQWITPELQAKASAQIATPPVAPAFPMAPGYPMAPNYPATAMGVPSGPPHTGWNPPGPAAPMTGPAWAAPAGAALPSIPGLTPPPAAAQPPAPPVAAPPAAPVPPMPPMWAQTAPTVPQPMASSFTQSTVPAPALGSGNYFNNPAPTQPAAPAAQPDPVAASLPPAAADFAPPAAPQPPAPVAPPIPAPPSAPVPPQAMSSIDFLKQTANKAAGV